MRTIFILMDSLNRHYLNAYGTGWIETPNLDRLARRGVVFDNHWIGSAPCMPARRDMLTGRLGFLERQWGGLEPYDTTLPRLLRMARLPALAEAVRPYTRRAVARALAVSLVFNVLQIGWNVAIARGLGLNLPLV